MTAHEASHVRRIRMPLVNLDLCFDFGLPLLFFNRGTTKENAAQPVFLTHDFVKGTARA